MSLILITMVAAANAVQAPAVPPADKPAKICREDERRLGSHIRGGRRCLTAEEWLQEDAARDRMPLRAQITAGQGDGLPVKPRAH